MQMLPTLPHAEITYGHLNDEEPKAFISDGYSAARELIASRKNVSPKRLVEPGPSAAQLDDLFCLAAAAPDHGLLTPWRFVLIAPEQRHLLAEVFALSLIERDPSATLEQIESAREKAHRAPILFVCIACLGQREPNIPALERMISMGAAVQNMLLGAQAMGFGSGLTSGKAMSSMRLRNLLSLVDGEEAVCCINLGTAVKPRLGRQRPSTLAFVSSLSSTSVATH